MPKLRKVWSSWNYMSTKASGTQDVCLTYWMNRLQPFMPQGPKHDVFITLNPLTEPRKETVMAEYNYEHPVYSLEVRLLSGLGSVDRAALTQTPFLARLPTHTAWATDGRGAGYRRTRRGLPTDGQLVQAQARLKEIQGATNTWFCGAWTNFGFHEDGLTSGFRVAEALGAKSPFPIVDATHIRPVPAKL